MPPNGATSSVSCSQHQLGGALHHPPDAAGADEHVMRFLLEHELAGAGQRVEAALRQRRQLKLAVPVGEVGEHEKGQPVGGRLVERAQDAGIVGVAGMAGEQQVGLVAAVPAEVGVQQVDHGPQMPGLLDVDLEQVAQVVEARRGLAQGGAAARPRPARCRPAPRSSRRRSARSSPGTDRPHRLAQAVAEAHGAVRLGIGQEDAPAVVRHLHVVEVSPAFLADGDRGAEVDVVVLMGDWSRSPPPVEELGLPALEGPLQPAVLGQPDVVGDLLGQIDGAHRLLTRLNFLRLGAGRTPAGSRCHNDAAPPLHPRHWGARRSSSARPRAARRSWSRWSPVPAKRRRRLHAGQGVRGEGGPLLEHQPDLVVPVDVVGGEGHQPRVRGTRRPRGPGRTRPGPRRSRSGWPQKRVARRLRPLAIGQASVVDGAEMERLAPARSLSSRCPSSMKERSAARASSASVPAKQLPGSIRATSVRAETSSRSQGPGPVRPDLADQPVAVVIVKGSFDGAGRGRPRLRS